MMKQTYPSQRMDTLVPIVLFKPYAVQLDDKFITGYVSSCLRLSIFGQLCGSDHVCTKNEAKILRRHDQFLDRQMMALSEKDRATASQMIANKMVATSLYVIQDFELDGDFESEILNKFSKKMKNRFA